MNDQRYNTGATTRHAQITDFTPGPRLDDAIRRCAGHAVAAGFAELLRAAAAGRIGLTAIMDRRAIWTPRRLRSSLPTVLSIIPKPGTGPHPVAEAGV